MADEIKESLELIYSVLKSIQEDTATIKLVLVETNEERIRRENNLESGITRVRAKAEAIDDRVNVLEDRIRHLEVELHGAAE